MIKAIENDLESLRENGTELLVYLYLPMLIGIYKMAGKIDDGLCVIEKTFHAIKKNNEFVFEAELYRIKGELLLEKAEPEMQAMVCFQEAINIARRQQSKTLELRAVMSMSRLLHKQGEKKEAIETLKNIYNWFSEGFETPDLMDARALLNSYSSGSDEE